MSVAGAGWAAVSTGTERTLPLLVSPMAGEALDSWLEALAHRHDAPFGLILQRCGIHPESMSRAMTGVDRGLLGRVARITGVEPDELHSMTLARYADMGIACAGSGQRARPTAWGWLTTSRWCPRCLEESSGRWLLAWRLNWSFACTTHGCLLVDLCPSCGGVQGRHAHSTLRIPQPGRCALTRPTDTAHGRVPCLTDLTTAPRSTAPDMPSVLNAQRCIDDLLAGSPVDLPLYEGELPSHRQLLLDIAIVARWAAGVPTTPGRELRVAGRHSQLLQGNRSARDVAVGATFALAVLQSPSVADAIELLQRCSTHAATTRPPGSVNLSPALLRAVERIRQ